MADASSGLEPDLSSYGNYAATNRLLATPSNTADSLNGWLTAARQGVALSTAQQQLAATHLSALNTLAGSVVDNPTQDNAHDKIMQAVRMGVLPPDEGAKEMSTIASLGDPNDPNTAAKVKAWAYDALSSTFSAQQHLANAYGTPSTVDNGQTISPVLTREGPQAGVYAAGGNPLQKYMSPGEANAPATFTPPGGTPVSTTVRGYGQAVGDTAGLPPTMGSPGPSPQPAAGYTDGVGSPNSYVDPRRAATSTVSIGPDGHPVYTPVAPVVAPAPAGTRPGDVIKPGPVGGRSQFGSAPTIAGPGFNAQPQPQSQVAGTPQPAVPGLAGPSPMLASGRQAYTDDLQNSSAKLQGVQPLLAAVPLIQQLGATGSGPGTKAFNDAKSALVSAGVIPAGLTDVDVRDEANKYLNQYVARSGIAQRSDMGTLVSQQSSPNLDTSNAATQALTRNAIAQDRMEAARPLAYDGGDNLAGYGQYKAGWTQSQDPRAYQLDVMPADQRTALLQRMATNYRGPKGPAQAEAARFFTSMQNAQRVGVRPPSAPAAGGANGQ